MGAAAGGHAGGDRADAVPAWLAQRSCHGRACGGVDAGVRQGCGDAADGRRQRHRPTSGATADTAVTATRTAGASIAVPTTSAAATASESQPAAVTSDAAAAATIAEPATAKPQPAT
eukprot:25415-Chlamydomonas_euryale.AAC.1